MESENTSIGNEVIAFYNVENLFPPEDFPKNPNASVSGLKNWNKKRYENKLFKIAHVFQLIEEQHALPMMIGLSEVSAMSVLKDLIELEPFNNGFGIVHYESLDERGVDVALLYDKSKIEILESEPISFVFEIEDNDPENYDTTRDVLYCKVKSREVIMNVFVLHLPSKRENDVNKPKRDFILKSIRERVENLMEKQEAVLLIGDFNENPDDQNLQQFLVNEQHQQVLFNPFLEVYKQHSYSTFHQRFGLLFDQMILSKDFFQADFPLNFLKALVFNHPKIANWDKKYLGRPFRTYAGTRYLGGYSDHFPVVSIFERS